MKSNSAVIAHVDIVGSTEFVRQNILLAHQRIQALYSRILKIVDIHSGCVYELRGDAAVIGFESARQAVEAMLMLQDTNTLLNSTRIGQIEPKMRVGISRGEVVTGNNTITGKPVIISQRLEQLAKPSQVLVDDGVRQALHSQDNFKLDFCNTETLKGFASPTTFYSVSSQASPSKQKQKALSLFSHQYYQVAGGTG